MKLNEASYFPDATELTRHGFASHMENLIGRLLDQNNDPLTVDCDDYLKGFGIDFKNALEMLTKPSIEGVPESAVLIRTEKIKNGGYDENGKPMKDKFQIIYKVPKRDQERGIKGIDEKLRDIYIKLFENHIVEGTILNEDDGGCGIEAGPGEEGVFSDAKLSVPLGRKTTGNVKDDEKEQFPVIRRKTVYITETQMIELAKMLKEEAVMDTQAGDFGYDAPGLEIDSDDETMDHEEMLKDDNLMGEGKSKIHIKKKNKGKFTATKKRTGKSTEELTHSKNPLTRKRAVFAQNVRRWSKK